jgi:hypothetical protein
MRVQQSKWWAPAEEPIDYSDLDATGQPLFLFDPGEISTSDIDAAGMLEKVDLVGGPCLRGTFTLENDFTIQAGFFLKLPRADIAMPGVAANDIVAVDSLDLLPHITAWATDNTISIGAFNHYSTNKTILAGTVFHFAVYIA